MFPWALELCHSFVGPEGLKGFLHHVYVPLCMRVCVVFYVSELQPAGHEAVPGGLQCRILLNLEYFSLRGLNWSRHTGIWERQKEKTEGQAVRVPFLHCPSRGSRKLMDPTPAHLQISGETSYGPQVTPLPTECHKNHIKI